MKLIEVLFDTPHEQIKFINNCFVGTTHDRNAVYEDLLDFERYEHYNKQYLPFEFLKLVVNKSKRIKNKECRTNFTQSVYNHKWYKKGEKHLSSGILNKNKQKETFRKNKLKRKKK